MHRRPRLTRLSASVVLLGTVTACSGDRPVEPARNGGSQACKDVETRLPPRVLGEQRVPVTAAGVGTWGEPPIVLRCGVPVPGPTSDPCLTIDDVDWLYRDEGGDARFVTYGRDPAVEVTVPESYGRENAPAALPDLAGAVRSIPASKRCDG